MSIKQTLSTPAHTQFRLHQAIRHITYAMQMDQPDSGVAFQVRLALAQVRAHRQEMRDQGRRAPDYRDDFIVPSADLLYTAARHILTMIQMEEHGERGATAACRQAEAALRTWLRRDMAEKEERERM